MKNNNIAWVIAAKDDSGIVKYVSKNDDGNYTDYLNKALLFNTRQLARENRVYSVYGDEQVKKVKISVELV